MNKIILLLILVMMQGCKQATLVESFLGIATTFVAVSAYILTLNLPNKKKLSMNDTNTGYLALREELIKELKEFPGFIKSRRSHLSFLSLKVEKAYGAFFDEKITDALLAEGESIIRLGWLSRLEAGYVYTYPEVLEMLNKVLSCKQSLITSSDTRLRLMKKFKERDQFVRNFLLVAKILRNKAMECSSPLDEDKETIFERLTKVTQYYHKHYGVAKELKEYYKSIII